MFNRILNLWKQSLEWVTYPTLEHHLLHSAGAGALVLTLMAFGVSWLLAAIVITLFTIGVEVASVKFGREEVHNAVMDVVEYQLQWVAYLVWISQFVWAGAVLVLLLGVYLKLLLGQSAESS